MTLWMRSAVTILLAVFAVVLGAAPASATPAIVAADDPPTLCQVTSKGSTWSGGYIEDVTIKNVSSVIVTWEAKITLTGNTVTVYWNAKFTRSTSGFTVAPVAHNGVIAPGGTVTFGYSGAGSPPAAVVTCKPIS